MSKKQIRKDVVAAIRDDAIDAVNDRIAGAIAIVELIELGGRSNEIPDSTISHAAFALREHLYSIKGDVAEIIEAANQK